MHGRHKKRSVAAGYAFFLSPNQTPYRDMYFLEKLSGLGVNDGVQINAVFTQLFFVMGLWPCIYAALLIPSARSGNKVIGLLGIPIRSACMPCTRDMPARRLRLSSTLQL